MYTFFDLDLDTYIIRMVTQYQGMRSRSVFLTFTLTDTGTTPDNYVSDFKVAYVSPDTLTLSFYPPKAAPVSSYQIFWALVEGGFTGQQLGSVVVDYRQYNVFTNGSGVNLVSSPCFLPSVI